ncbi:MAG TPA: PQQ-dependent sugar dehydrogenase [Asanoa sp.]|nr:PQQ-dependent sugar dehydrogenase [Asanoa sp.]
MSRARIALIVVTVAVLAAALFGGAAAWRGWFSDPSVPSAPDAAPASVTDVVTGLRAPWGLAFRPDGSALVTERDTKRILSVQGTTARELTVVDEARPAGEGGLLGIAVAPAGDWVYVYYTAADDNRIARFRPDQPDARSTVFTGIPKAGNHNGGRIAFGPDGMLYVGTGDAGQRDAAQDRASLGGKILRLTPEGAPAPGNPFGATPVFSYGHRNVQGLAWDASGAMFASEFGQNTYDELNRIEPGHNYGWPEAEGASSDPAFTNPIATWRTADASPSGIAVGPDGRLWMACLRGERLYAIGTDGGGAQALLRGEHGRLRHVAAAPDGSMWVLTSNHDGRGDPAPGDDRILRLTT